MKHLLSLVVFASLVAFSNAQEKPAKADKPKAPPAATPAPKPAEASVGETPRVATPTTASNDVPAQVAGIFFGLLQKGQIDPAYEGLTKGSKIAERPEELRTLKQKTKEATDVFGPIQSYELVESKLVGTHLLRRTYLSLNKEFPLRWRFYFYLSDNTWRLIDLRVDDRVTGMFDETDEPKPVPETK
jgi:hypothetical protein